MHTILLVRGIPQLINQLIRNSTDITPLFTTYTGNVIASLRLPHPSPANTQFRVLG
jgi:hypothetical protein